MSKPQISFIFVNYRSAALLPGALDSLAPIRGEVSIECIIVNNDASERAAIDALVSGRPDVKVKHLEANVGFGRANNVGAVLAEGEVLFFLNPDTRFERGNVRGLLAALAYRPKTLFGGILYDAAGNREKWSSGEIPDFVTICVNNCLAGLIEKTWETTVFTPTGWVSGAALCVSRDFFQSLGGFDETFFLYFEDVDLCVRARSEGGSVAVYPFLSFQHTGGASHRNVREKKRAYFESQTKFFLKWRPHYETALLTLFRRLFTPSF